MLLSLALVGRLLIVVGIESWQEGIEDSEWLQ